MAYEFPKNQCRPDGIPFCKVAGAWLEKDGVPKLFMKQGELDQAWQDGWHAVNCPESAITKEVIQTEAEPAVENDIPEKPRKRGRPKRGE